MLNPILSNTKIQFTDALFPQEIVKKYDDFLFHKNYALKSIGGLIYESIQNVELPGLNLNTLIIQALANTGKTKKDFNHVTINRGYPGTDPLNTVIENSILTLTMKNYLINWMYFYEMNHNYYARKRTVEQFGITIIALDSAELPIIKFTLKNCFIQMLPGLAFSFNSSYNESKTIDIGIFFNSMDVDFLIPNFALDVINL